MNYAEAYHVYKSWGCYRNRSIAYRRLIQIVSECMASSDHNHEYIGSFFQEFGILYENLHVILNHYSGCYECANIIIEYGEPYIINPLLHMLKSKNNHYMSFVQVYHERSILPLIVGIRSESSLHPITKHPLYTRDVWRSVFRLIL